MKNTGAFWIERELAEAALLIVRQQTGVSRADIVDPYYWSKWAHATKYRVIRYYYPIAALEMFIALELKRKMEYLQRVLAYSAMKGTKTTGRNGGLE